MADKAKHEATRAWAVARELVMHLTPACERIEVAGSLRRGKREVGDVEIVFVPRRKAVPVEMDLLGVALSPSTEPETDAVLERLLKGGVIEKRSNVDGHDAWGPLNKLARHCRTFIPVDLFATTQACFWNYLVCRTGGAAMNKEICRAAIRKGWKWNPYGEGFTDGVGVIHPAQTEQAVFELVGLKYLEPTQRF